MNQYTIRDVKNYLKKKDVSLKREYLLAYTVFFNVMNEVSNGKLTMDEIIDAYDFLGDVVTNKRPDVCLVEKKDRIRVPYRLFEELPYTQGKLTHEEKINLSFCIYYANCVRIYDEKTDEIYLGFQDIDSVEKLFAAKEKDMQFCPERYDIEDKLYFLIEPFGYSPDNPICTTSVHAEYVYLNQLRDAYNCCIPYERIGSISGKDGQILDKFVLYILGAFCTEIKKVELYIDGYSNFISDQAPEGLFMSAQWENMQDEWNKLKIHENMQCFGLDVMMKEKMRYGIIDEVYYNYAFSVVSMDYTHPGEYMVLHTNWRTARSQPLNPASVLMYLQRLQMIPDIYNQSFYLIDIGIEKKDGELKVAGEFEPGVVYHYYASKPQIFYSPEI